MIKRENFCAKLTINLIKVNGVVEKTATLEVVDRFGNQFEYDITDAEAIQKMLEEYDLPENGMIDFDYLRHTLECIFDCNLPQLDKQYRDSIINTILTRVRDIIGR